jgi:transcriptional regulator with XRE-family HTH domain
MNLKDYLDKKSITITRFASFVEVSQSHISNIILGKKKPSIDLVKKITRATKGAVSIVDLLNISTEDLITEKKEE